MTKLIVAVGNFAKAPKMHHNYYCYVQQLDVGLARLYGPAVTNTVSLEFLKELGNTEFEGLREKLPLKNNFAR
jgi:hypothetical protein